MKLGIRTGAVIIAGVMSVAVGLAYWASDRVHTAGMSTLESRGAMLQTYRIAQSLKSLIHGYELTINEYYSTVLEYSNYQKKAGEYKESIDSELAALEKLETGDATAVGDLKTALNEIEGLRLELEAALNRPDKNWDLAREALFKLNVVSVRAVQPAERIANIAGEHALAEDSALRQYQSQALQALRLVMALLVLAGVMTMLGAFRQKQVNSSVQET